MKLFLSTLFLSIALSTTIKAQGNFIFRANYFATCPDNIESPVKVTILYENGFLFIIDFDSDNKVVYEKMEFVHMKDRIYVSEKTLYYYIVNLDRKFLSVMDKSGAEGNCIIYKKHSEN